MARSRPKMAPEVGLLKSLMTIPRDFKRTVEEFVNYALVGLNARKSCFKSGTAESGFGHLFKKTKKPFFPESIYSRFVSGDITEYGVNVAKISKVQYC